MLYGLNQVVRLHYLAWDYTNGQPKTGLAANLTLQVYNPAGALVTTYDIALGQISEMGAGGVYYVDRSFDTLGPWVVRWYCSDVGCEHAKAELIEISQAHIGFGATAPGAPPVGNTCRVYDFPRTAGGAIPDSAPRAPGRIVSLPHDYDGLSWSGEEITGEWNAATGTVYWDVPWTAKVNFQIIGFGINETKVVPSIVTVRLQDI